MQEPQYAPPAAQPTSAASQASPPRAAGPSSRLSHFRRSQGPGRSTDDASVSSTSASANSLLSASHRRPSNGELTPAPAATPKGSRFSRLRKAQSRAFDDDEDLRPSSSMAPANGGEHAAKAEGRSSSTPAGSRSPAKRQQLSAARLSEHVLGSGQPQREGETFLPRRLSGWFNSVLSTSPPPPPVPRLPDQAQKSSSAGGGLHAPARVTPKAPSGLDKMLDRAANFLMDLDSSVDKCPDDIWLLGGVLHEGWRPIAADEPPTRDKPRSSVKRMKRKGRRKRDSQTVQPSNGSGLSTVRPASEDEIPSSLVSPSRTSLAASSLPPSTSPPSSSALSSPPSPSRLSATSSYERSSISLPTTPSPSQTHGWPARFYHDFASRIQLTYRSGFPPIPCNPPSAGLFNQVLGSLTASIGRGSSAAGAQSGEGLSSDTGWGCMLRTGQSLLANALLDVHLGRDWRRTLPTPSSAQTAVANPPFFASYVRLLSWFMDDPSPLCPFSVHRFAFMGKQLGKQVGEWFGPSTAAGAIKALANDFTPAGLGVATAIDGTLYKTDVLAAAAGSEASRSWGRPVLILLNLRLGLNGVNPVYHDSIKAIFTFPQSVGIAGGRPSSSYFFVGCQANSLFYIDPHHTKPAVPFRPPPASLHAAALAQSMRTNMPEDWETVDSPFAPSDAEVSGLDAFYRQAYSEVELRSFHCDRVRKMALTGLDPSMLVGFLCHTEADFEDLCTRLRSTGTSTAQLVHIADRPPAWARSLSSSRVAGTGSRSTSTTSRNASARPAGASELSNAADATPPSAESDADEASFDEPDDWDVLDDDGDNEAGQIPSRPGVARGCTDEGWEGVASETASDTQPTPTRKMHDLA